MICPNCQRSTSRIIMRSGNKACASCWGLSEAAGVKVDGTLTRKSQRVRDQHRRHEGDIIPPHVFDHVTKGLKPNPDFLQRYPDKITTNFSQSELEKAGHSKIGKLFKKDKERRATHAREQAAGITYRQPNAKIKPPV